MKTIVVIWVILTITLVLTVLTRGYRRVNVERKAHAERIEDKQAIQAYDRTNRWRVFNFMRRRIVGQLKKHSPEGVLVDVGCGPGYLVTAIAKSFPQLRIIGIDIAKEMIQIATDKLSSLGFNEQVEFRQGDAQGLPFQNNTVDFVVSTLSLHHWRNASEALEEIYRVLNAGGQFLLFDFRRDERQLSYWFLRLAQTFVVPSPLRRINEPAVSVLSSYTPVELDALLSATSFQEWKIKPGLGWLFVWGHKR
jgi:ubiquinone/menaquinone biosynthesis C-methylase UbiE